MARSKAKRKYTKPENFPPPAEGSHCHGCNKRVFSNTKEGKAVLYGRLCDRCLARCGKVNCGWGAA